MSKLPNLQQWILKSPILWGLGGAAGFYALIHAGPLKYPLVQRYFTGHPVEYMETVLFAVGLAALLVKAVEIAGERIGLGQSPLGPMLQAEPTEENCRVLLGELDRLPARRQGDYYVRRLRSAIEYVAGRGSAEGLGDELKYLADMDAGRLQNSYGLFRVIVWAIPILGFLGTVIGITMALNSVDLQAPDQSMVQVLTGLGLKFDTTALALTLSMVLMFIHFYIERIDYALLEAVDRQVDEEMGGRFVQLAPGPDGQVAALRQMAEAMVHASERLVERQAEIWRQSMEAAGARWAQMADAAGAKLQAALSGALTESLKVHAQQLATAQQAAAQDAHKQWDRLLQNQGQSLGSLRELQESVARQMEVLERATAAASDITRMEDALNRNLSALAGAKHFDQTVLSLAAAINLLNARLAETPAAPVVKLEATRRTPHAA